MPRKPRKKKMPDTTEPVVTPAEESPEVLKARMDTQKRVTLEITRSADGTSYSIYLRAPLLADIVDKMATGHFAKSQVDKVYKPILQEVGDKKEHFRTRPGLKVASALLEGATDFRFDAKPRTLLFSNPTALREGFTLSVTPETPVSPDIIKEWGKQVMGAASQIITNARAFKLVWNADAVPEYRPDGSIAPTPVVPF